MNGKMWFGTTDYMQWIDAPVSGADMSPEGWGVGGTLLNGGGYGVGSFGSHKVYTFEWKGSSAPRAAQLMKSYADGTYGRGLLYFIDPLIYGLNILPARYADPSMATDYEGGSLVYGVSPQRVPNAGWRDGGFPAFGAFYNLADTPEGFRGREEALFIPIPAGYALRIGAVYEATGSGGLFYNAHLNTGLPSDSPVHIPSISFLDNDRVSSVTVTGSPGIWLWMGKDSAGAASVTMRSMVARLIPLDATDAEVNLLTREPWIGGMGHSGCRISGKPSYVATGGARGGQVGYAATFVEVGSWG